MAKVLNYRVPRGAYAVFSLSNKPEMRIKMDVADFNRLVKGKNCWYVHVCKKAKDGYERAYVRTAWQKGVSHRHLHREVLEAGKFDYKDSVVDHLNGDSLDNRRRNLRLGTVYDNVRNPNNKTRGNMRHKKIKAYKDCNICEKHSYNKTQESTIYYQAYDGKKYIACRKTLEELHKVIDAYRGE